VFEGAAQARTEEPVASAASDRRLPVRKIDALAVKLQAEGRKDGESCSSE